MNTIKVQKVAIPESRLGGGEYIENLILGKAGLLAAAQEKFLEGTIVKQWTLELEKADISRANPCRVKQLNPFALLSTPLQASQEGFPD